MRTDKPKSIGVLVTCQCGKKLIVRTKGDWKRKECWKCGSQIYLRTYPKPMIVEINGQRVNFEIVEEEDNEDQE